MPNCLPENSLRHSQPLIDASFCAARSYCALVIDGVPEHRVADLLGLAEARLEIGSHTSHHHRVAALTVLALGEDRQSIVVLGSLRADDNYVYIVEKRH